METQQPTVSKGRPTLVTIIAILTIIIACWYFLLFREIVASSDFIQPIIAYYLSIIVPIISIIAAVGLLKMKKWASYIYFFGLGYAFVMSIVPVIRLWLLASTSTSELSRELLMFSIPTITIAIICILIFIYLWSIRRKFN